MKGIPLLAILALLSGCGNEPDSTRSFPLDYQALTTEGPISAFRIGPGAFLTSSMRIWGEDPEGNSALEFQAPTVHPGDGENPELEEGPYRLICATMTDPRTERWVTVRAENLAPKLDDYDFVACVRFDLVTDEAIIEHAVGPRTGEPYISQPARQSCPLPKGDYSLYVCAKNVGKHPAFEQLSLADEDFQNLPIESYDLIFVPKEAPEYGVIIALE